MLKIPIPDSSLGWDDDGPQSFVKMMILETDEPHPKSKEERGTYAEILRDHFKRAGDAHDPPLGIETDSRFVVADKGGALPRIDEFDGCHAVLITGSTYDAHDVETGWVLGLLALLKSLWRTRPDMRFSGVCFGHQLLCRMLGSEVAPSPSRDWELGHSRIGLTDVGRRLFQTSQPSIFLHQMHQDHVVAAPDSYSSPLLESGARVSVWGSSPHTAVQGVYIPRRLFTTQAHLAFDEAMVRREMQMRVEAGAIDVVGQDGDHRTGGDHSEQVDRAAATAHLDHDGEVAAAAILRFFHGEDDEIK